MRAVVLSVAAFFIPVLHTFLVGDTSGSPIVLLWLVPLLPAFLLAYYRGWQGAATALAAAMAALAFSQAYLIFMGTRLQDRPMIFWVAAALTAIGLVVGFTSEQLHRGRSAAEMLALTDDLTGVPNRRRLRMFLDEEFSRSSPTRPISVVMFDLDAFKSYNDRNGHPAGDAVLKQFAATLSNMTRKRDISGRYGGEEFLSILVDCDGNGASIFAERIRSAFRDTQAHSDVLTVSAGIAAYDPGMKSASDLLIAVDKALYFAKGAGRNCVQIFRPALAKTAS